MKRFVIAVFCVLIVSVSRAERFGFERYQPILDRQMFGPVPEGFDPTRPPSEVQKSSGRTEKELTREQEQVKKSVKFSMINLNPKGETMVGFTDNSDPKEARHYYLKVGESRDGWTVKAADAVAATVSISKDGVDLDLELGSGSGGAAAAGAAGVGVASPGGLRRGGLLGGGIGASRLSGGAGSLRERRMAKLQQREANEKAAAEDQAKRAAEAEAEKAKAEEEKAQREAEREQQRQQLMQIQEELKRAREARQAAEAADAENSDNSSATADE